MEEQERLTLIDDVMRVSARIMAKAGIGSGTMIYSKDNETYLLTCHHVIEKNIQYKDVWDVIIKKNVKRDFTSPVEVHTYRLDKVGRVLGLESVMADIVDYDAMQDIALLRIEDPKSYPCARLYPVKEAKNPPMLIPLACCGAALGEKPVVTFGNLNGVQVDIDNYEYYLNSASSIFGNSGGGVFTPYEGRWHFLGIPSKISLTFIGWSANAITHMGYFTPIKRIYKWLDDICHQFIYDSSYTREKCQKLRKEKKEKELAIYMRSKSD